MAKIGGDRWRGNVGVRVIRTDQDTVQYSANAPTTITNQFGSFGQVNVSKDYTDVLPSLNLSFDASDSVTDFGIDCTLEDSFSVVKRALFDAARGHELSVYGLPMKGSLVAAKLIPHHLLVPAMNKILNRRSRDSE